MVEIKKEKSEDQFAAIGEVIDFIGDLSSNKFSGMVEIQFKRGEARRWSKLSKFRRIGGGDGQWQKT